MLNLNRQSRFFVYYLKQIYDDLEIEILMFRIFSFQHELNVQDQYSSMKVVLKIQLYEND